MKTLYADAFAEQIALLRARMNASMPRLGWKVGINVPEVQRKLGLEHSLVGWLDADRLFSSGATVAIPTGGNLHVEPELCLRMVKPVTSLADREAAVAAVGAIAPALELVDYARPASGLDDVVRGSMFHFACTLGDWQPPRASLDIASSVSLRVDGVASAPARSDLVPAHLADLVLFVAKLLSEAGEQIVAGDHILSGSFTAKAVALRAGQSAEATLGEFGTVRCAAAC
jgi:2-keto-4-pentenoate hydratase